MFDSTIVTVDASGNGVLSRSNRDYYGSDGINDTAINSSTGAVLPGPARQYKVFEAARQDSRGMPAKKPVANCSSSFVSRYIFFKPKPARLDTEALHTMRLDRSKGRT
jgi:hypothetical protein